MEVEGLKYDAGNMTLAAWHTESTSPRLAAQLQFPPHMHPPPFPPEIWTHTVSLLPISQQKLLLGVSRFFHDLALRFVFSSVKVYILGGYRVCQMLDTNNESFAIEVEQNLMRRSWEILYRILTDTQFALLVRDMTVVAFSDFPTIFEIRESVT